MSVRKRDADDDPEMRPLIGNPLIQEAVALGRDFVNTDQATFTLAEHGVQVFADLPLDPGSDLAKLKISARTWPLFNHNAKPIDEMEFVAGGFGALANPGSLHSAGVREVRLGVQQAVLQKLLPIMDDMGATRYQALFDRLMWRLPGKKPSAEVWHRDLSPWTKENNIVLGGWYNCSEYDQKFSCVPGTQVEGARLATNASGFSSLKPDAEERRALRSVAQTVIIPPGAVLVFDQTLVHEVVSRKVSHLITRMFMAWNFIKGQSGNAARLNYDTTIARMTVPPLKSKQQMPMYPRLYLTNWQSKLDAWSRSFVNDAFVTLRTIGSGTRAGQTFKAPERFIGAGLKELNSQIGVPFDETYSEEERAMFAINAIAPAVAF